MPKRHRQNKFENRHKEFIELLRIFARDYLLHNDDKIKDCANYIGISENYLRGTMLVQRRKGSFKAWFGVYDWIAGDGGSDLNTSTHFILCKDSPFSRKEQPSLQLFSTLNRFKFVDEEVMLRLAQALYETIARIDLNSQRQHKKK